MRHRLILGVLGCLLVTACGGGGGAPDAAPADGAPDVATSDGGEDGAVDGSPADAADDAGTLPAPTSVSANVCPGAGSVATTLDGSLVAYLDCSGAPVAFVFDVLAGEARNLGPAGELADGPTVAFDPSGGYVLFGSPTTLMLRDVAAAAPAFLVGSGEVSAHRFVERPDGAASTTWSLVAVVDVGAGSLDVVARDLAPPAGRPYSNTRTLTADIGGWDTELVSSNGANIFVERGVGAAASYSRVPTIDGDAPTTFSYGPADFALGPAGLGNTHGIARVGDGLVFLELGTEVVVQLLDALLTEVSPLVFTLDQGGETYAYFVVDGAPTRRLRNGSGPLEPLAGAVTDRLGASPDGAHIVFRAADGVRSVPADGSGPAVVALDGAGDDARWLFRPGDPTVMLVEGGGRVVRVGVTGADRQVLEAGGVVAGTSLYVGTAALWRATVAPDGRENALRVAQRTDTGGRTLAQNVDRAWALGDDRVLVWRTGGELVYLSTAP